MKEKILKLKQKGFFSIYISTIFSKVITLLGGVLIVRLLSKNDYSNYVLIINAISVLSFFGDFGASNATLQLMIESKKNLRKKKAFAIYGFKIAFISSFISSLLILFSKLFYPFKNIIVGNYTLILFLIPIITTIINFISIIFRAEERNKMYSYYQLATTFFHYFVLIVMTFVWGLFGSLLAQYCYNLIILLVGVYLIKKIINKNGKSESLEVTEKKEFLKLAFGSQINNSLVNLLHTIDIFILGFLAISNDNLAVYKVATIIPSALSFLPQCLMIFLIPYFAKNNKNTDWIQKNLIKITKYGFLGYGLISLLLILTSKYIITILYGKAYISALLPFNIFIINFFINSTFKTPISNMLYSIHKINASLIINLISLFLNFIFNLIFIKKFGYIGAAYATVLVTIIASILNIIYITKCLRSMENETNNG